MLSRNHPALGAFRKRAPVDWQYIADELAVELRRKTVHDNYYECGCNAHIILRAYDAAKSPGAR